jgi:hypothetical protein
VSNEGEVEDEKFNLEAKKMDDRDSSCGSDTDTGSCSSDSSSDICSRGTAVVEL